MNAQQKLSILPRATTIWLIENTALTFKQIGDFCGIHEFEIKSIVDGEISQDIMVLDPITGGQLNKEEIIRCTKDSSSSLKISTSSAYDLVSAKWKQHSKYALTTRCQDKPGARFWLLKNYLEILDGQVIKLVCTTKLSYHRNDS